MAKKKTNTPQEKKAVKKSFVCAVLLVSMLVFGIVTWFTQKASPEIEISTEEEREIETIKYKKLLPDSKWKLSENTVPQDALPELFKNLDYINIEEDLKQIDFETSKATIVGTFEFTAPDSAQIDVFGQIYPVKFSDMKNKSYDQNNYLMRITVQNLGYLDFFIQDL